MLIRRRCRQRSHWVPKPKAMPEVTRLTDEQVDVCCGFRPVSCRQITGRFTRPSTRGKAEGWVPDAGRRACSGGCGHFAPKDQADTALKSAMDGLWYKNVANRPAASAEEAARNIQAGYYEILQRRRFPREVKELSAGRKNLEGMRKWVENSRKMQLKRRKLGSWVLPQMRRREMQARA